MHKDLMIAKARENCRVSKYLIDSRDSLKRSIDELDVAIELLSAVHYDDEVEHITAAKKTLEELMKYLDNKSSDLTSEAMALTDKAQRMDG